MKNKTARNPAERVGFFAELPRSAVTEIKRRTKVTGKAQWEVLVAALKDSK
jgi:hypothetical protein